MSLPLFTPVVLLFLFTTLVACEKQLVEIENTSDPSIDEEGVLTVSAPIFPKYWNFDDYSGPNYKFDKKDQDHILHNGFLTFEQLYNSCINDISYGSKLDIYNELDRELTNDEFLEKYEILGSCAYELLEIYPYYVPQFHEDVDICILLNTEKYHWRMITEEDVNSSPMKFFKLLHSVQSQKINKHALGKFYFSPLTFINSKDGLKLGILMPNVDSENRVKNLPYRENENSFDIFEGVGNSYVPELSKSRIHQVVTLRCLRIEPK